MERQDIAKAAFFRVFRVLVALAAGLVLAGQAMAETGHDPAPAQEKRVALVVGMSHYQHVSPLDNPKNDAKLMAETLKTLGFTLVGGEAQIDLDKDALERAIRGFGQRIGDAEVALFYYAGHGVQVRGENWLVPVSADPQSENDVDFEMVAADLVLKQMEGGKKRLNIVILDACRNNPFGGRGLRDEGGGLAQMKAPEGTLISYATQPGNVAADGVDGDSPYTEALARTMVKPGYDLFHIMNEVGLSVKETTRDTQQPWWSTSPIDGEWYPAGKAQKETPPAVASNEAPKPEPPPAPGTAAGTGFDPREMELTYWTSIKESKDPADFEAYLAQYPHGTFASLAQHRINVLKAEAAKAKTEVAVNEPPKPAPEPRPRGPRLIVVEGVRYNGTDAPALSDLVTRSLSSLAGTKVEHRPPGKTYDIEVTGTIDLATVQDVTQTQPADQSGQALANAANAIFHQFGIASNLQQPAAAPTPQVVERVYRAQVTLMAIDHARRLMDREQGAAQITLAANVDRAQGLQQAARDATSDATIKIMQVLGRVIPAAAAK